MLSHTDLPGFPPPDTEDAPPTCVQCGQPVVPDPPADWGGYESGDVAKWVATLPACGAAADAEFPDLQGMLTAHEPNCDYRELPPAVMWFMNEELADDMRRKLWEARQPCRE
ncbi:hypothetical protein EJ357_28740 [Streptomyces cyaneochromogenes]|uniref:Uncharacterized protein n=1 Tax=Streptomyces cyaneochromogenes TaxID=2496836 RepID=A0A3S9MCS4_9ACTN|nr:hypothetical protein [Streptomyces cyaneochromogenes]AZQ36946.1 hypothetical protein EJ357_28740 [Streptomyces cyaneochromogenes]